MDSQSKAAKGKGDGSLSGMFSSLLSNLLADPGHIAELLRAAEPYITEDIRSSLDFLVSTLAFTAAMKNVQKNGFHLPSSLSGAITDMDGLLKSVRPHCTDQERELVDMVANLMNAQNFYRTYSEMASMFQDFQGTGTDTEPVYGQTADPGSTVPPEAEQAAQNGNEQMFDMLSEMLSPEQKNAFEAMKMMMS